LILRYRGSSAVAIAFVVPLIVLLASVRTEVGSWDTADLQTVAWIGGIPYPTGFPGYVIVGWIWTHLLPIGSVAARLNALSAVAIAGAAATITSLALLFEVMPLLAILAGWAFAFAHPVWLRATYADAHPVGFAVAFLAVALAVRWARLGDRRALSWAIVLGALALALDNTTVLILPGGIVVALARRPSLPRIAAAAGIGVLLLAAAYAYLPLRSAQVTAARRDPTLALGIPPGRPFWDDHHPASAQGFRELVTGSEWHPEGTMGRLFTIDSLRATIDRFVPELEGDLPEGLLVAAAFGVVAILAEAPLIGLGLLLAALPGPLFGGSYTAEADPDRYVFVLYALCALGIAVAAARAQRAFERDTPHVASVVIAGLLALTVLRDLSRGGDIFALRSSREAADLARRVAAATRDDAVVVEVWDFATPLGYDAYVQRTFGHRVVLCALPGDYKGFYPGWLRERRQLVIVNAGEPEIPGFRTRLLVGGYPAVYEVLPP
jgi:Protein of unknown function (DUF2723)